MASSPAEFAARLAKYDGQFSSALARAAKSSSTSSSLSSKEVPAAPSPVMDSGSSAVMVDAALVRPLCPSRPGSSAAAVAGSAIRTPSSTRWPRWRLSAATIGSRRWRSISFWTNGVGTDSRAKPSVSTSGCTSLSQARCCGVRVRPPAPGEPFSSVTTLFQMVTKGGSGSALTDT